jgi:hypothetical protein
MNESNEPTSGVADQADQQRANMESIRLQQVADLVLDVLSPDVKIYRPHAANGYRMIVHFGGYTSTIDVTEFIGRVKATGVIKPESADKAMFDKAIKELAAIIVAAK